ncbi:3-demethylubiquinone-9 3-methyltransferase [Dacryopinax primogenitus]|uniref:Ubiquinone biosynthesis O-methyltransferase, mitochondrial n=1 Tax=Dacryopinax primogenitus (strain DJM 731) TaxID=1858805 RepID=M5G570_DACPD|nr:3-demethylubiquinone-9 3-methyltransferase [Dacryopinax primogenitus]EJU03814.1 3-demethylubiquinone-9 3-methyltransferase [Dacryopinax primogenitus]
MLSVIPRQLGYSTRLFRHFATNAESLASPTVDPIEIEHFSKLSAQWWDEHGELKMLHRMNPPRVAWLKEKIAELRDLEGEPSSPSWKALGGLRILDIGCGGGLLSESLARLGASVTGVDAAASNIAIARIHQSHDHSLNNLVYRHAAVETLAVEGQQYDAVCAMEVLEHVDEPKNFLKSCAEVIKPGGHLFLSTISRTPFAHLLTIAIAENTLHLVSPGTHNYDKFIRPSELIKFFKDLGWLTGTYEDRPNAQEAEVRGIMYFPGNGDWQLSNRGSSWGEQCNYLFWARKPKTP